MQTLEGAHLAAGEELQALYDKRLELEAEKLRQVETHHRSVPCLTEMLHKTKG